MLQSYFFLFPHLGGICSSEFEIERAWDACANEIATKLSHIERNYLFGIHNLILGVCVHVFGIRFDFQLAFDCFVRVMQ